MPDDVFRRLRELAEAADRPLEEYLLAELARITATPTMDEVLDRIESRGSGRFGLQQAVDDLEAERR
ncbi:hypothetical protein [Pseudofrankia inefficax]|uniref:Uncharacterized protein n=1 Tax=Pseudofrankia inefficax (strain DSM 45817 / CECT 9037 / DDB 130130 / EuI1c) TaxID=298654 RepID=E3J611_PSEI1|nr:hypothetical protein [Pseudofrankia inefficax]ADP78302.1 hypothetical protein FraEuI1c_0214 [Pseudofrankia inefficax]